MWDHICHTFRKLKTILISNIRKMLWDINHHYKEEVAKKKKNHIQIYVHRSIWIMNILIEQSDSEYKLKEKFKISSWFEIRVEVYWKLHEFSLSVCFSVCLNFGLNNNLHLHPLFENWTWKSSINFKTSLHEALNHNVVQLWFECDLPVFEF